MSHLVFILEIYQISFNKTKHLLLFFSHQNEFWSPLAPCLSCHNHAAEQIKSRQIYKLFMKQQKNYQKIFLPPDINCYIFRWMSFDKYLQQSHNRKRRVIFALDKHGFRYQQTWLLLTTKTVFVKVKNSVP